MLKFVDKFSLLQIELENLYKFNMYDFLLQTSLFLSLGVIIYLLARAVPRVDEAGATIHSRGFFDRLLSRLPLKHIDERLTVLWEKFLRRAKVSILKLDNFINQKLGRLKKSEGSGAEKENRGNLFEKPNGDKKE